MPVRPSVRVRPPLCLIVRRRRLCVQACMCVLCSLECRYGTHALTPVHGVRRGHAAERRAEDGREGPVRPDGGVRGARQVRQLRPRRTPSHALLPGVSKVEYSVYRILRLPLNKVKIVTISMSH